MVELAKMVRQQGDNSYIKLLNKFGDGDFDEDADKAWLLRFVAKGTSNYPQRAVHIFVGNSPVDHHNETI